MSQSPPIVRIPPSPTGNLHVGTARTALYNYLFAKKHGGTVLFRLEDTDKARSKPEFEKNIIDGLMWLGITFDNHTIIRQSERTELYKQTLNTLIQRGVAYHSQEIPKDENSRTEVIRFKNPNKVITFHDTIRGLITFDTTELGDFIIAKSLEEPLYHLAVVADDIEMGITHVIRGEDHISNTPRQILLIEALGATRPEYAHIPLILGKDRSKLSKRQGATAVSDYKEAGYLPEAMINFLAFLGWNPGGERELYHLNELITVFELGNVQKGGAIFNQEKLDWFNREYIKTLSSTEKHTRVMNAFFKGLKPEQEKLFTENQSILTRSEPIILERITTFGDITKAVQTGEYDYLLSDPSIVRDTLLFKGTGDLPTVAKHLQTIQNIMLDISDNTHIEVIKTAIMPYAEIHGKGVVLWPLRYALTGRERSPDPFTIISLIGTEKTRRRIAHAITVATTPLA